MFEDNLPAGWTLTTLENVATWGSGGTPSRSEPSYYDGDIPWVKTGDLGPRVLYKASEFISELAIKNSSAKFFPKGSVAIAMYGATIGKTSILGIDATTNQACGVGNPIGGITFSEFLYYFLNNEKDNFIAKGKGGAQPNISQALIKEHPIPLPPLAEQKVIADKLDTLLAQVDNTKARLERIPEILKGFRQSVLAAAVSGKLTDTQSEWRREVLKNCFDCIDGDRGPNYPKKEDYKNDGYCLFLSTKNVREFGFDFADIVFIDKDKDQILRNGRLNRGDIVITTRGTLGYVASYDDTVPYKVVRINSGMLILRKKDPKFVNGYFKILVASPYFQKLIDEQRTGSAQPQLPAKILKEFMLPLPGYDEQTEIVRRVEVLFAFADRIEQAAQAALSRVNHLTQSILAKAFRGELTADWRNTNLELISGDNSAEALLAKIKVERAKLTKKAKA